MYGSGLYSPRVIIGTEILLVQIKQKMLSHFSLKDISDTTKSIISGNKYRASESTIQTFPCFGGLNGPEGTSVIESVVRFRLSNIIISD